MEVLKMKKTVRTLIGISLLSFLLNVPLLANGRIPKATYKKPSTITKVKVLTKLPSTNSLPAQDEEEGCTNILWHKHCGASEFSGSMGIQVVRRVRLW
jgi:hypothetical protein